MFKLAIYFSGFSTSHQSCALEVLVSQGQRLSPALHHRLYHRPRDPRTSTLYSTCLRSTPPYTYRTRARLSSLTNYFAFCLSALLLRASCRCCVIFAINYVKKAKRSCSKFFKPPHLFQLKAVAEIYMRVTLLLLLKGKI